MPDHTIVSRYTFPGCTRYIVAPWLSGVGHQHVTIRHSAGVASWMDRDTHLHTDSEEYYFVFQGELRLLVDGTVLTLKPYEVLMVKLGVTHTVLGGPGPLHASSPTSKALRLALPRTHGAVLYKV